MMSTQKEAIETAAKVLGDAYSRNVFPSMNVSWGTHPDRIGHEDYPGCQCCHDGGHKSASGRIIPAACRTCHTVLAQGEKNPKILSELQ